MPNMKAQTVAKLIVEEVICRLGVPVSIHSDQGRQYERLLFSEVCKHLQIRKTIYLIILKVLLVILYPQFDVIAAEMLEKDIIAISETYLDSSIDNNQINLTGFYPPLRRDRNRYGGGVALYISKNLHFTYRSDLESTHIVILWAEINACGKFF